MDVPLISLISSVMSRLSYFDNTHFLNKYLQIFSISELNNQILNIKNTDIANIFDLKTKNITKIIKKINNINYTIADSITLSSKDVQYICISDSNYSSVYIVANKLINTIFVCFRGTYSFKSGLSYLKLSSISPKKVCQNLDDGYLIGIFKIVFEIFYTIEESINYLKKHFLKTNDVKIVTTGHSLGGAASNIFSYLWVKHNPDLNLKMGCITFGSPRIMNGPLIEKYNQLIHNNIIMFKRYVNNGDPFGKLPITSKMFKSSYYFPDDYDVSLNYVAISCKDIKKTRKNVCNLKSKTKKRRDNVKYHGMYLGISYKEAANNLLNLNKEIARSQNNNNTICRIIIGGNNNKIKAVFFNLNEAKVKNKGYISVKLEKIKKKFQLDYKHQDIYINEKMFEKLIENSYELDDGNLNPLVSNTLVKIQHKSHKKLLLCI